MHVFIYSGKEIPRFSTRYVTVDTSAKSQVISLSNKLHRIRLQPDPYDTRCDPMQDGVACFEDCLYQARGRLDRLPYSSRCDEQLPLHILSYTDLTNETMNQLWIDIEHQCEEACTREVCDLEFTTTTHEGAVKVNGSRILFAVLSPSFPNTIVTAVPMMRFYEFTYQIFCCLSFWLGFAIINLNPVTFIERRHSECLKRSIDRKLRILCKKIDKLHRYTMSRIKFSGSPLSLRELVKLKFILYLIAMCGCSYHIYYSTRLYFRYSAFIDVMQSKETQTDVHFLLCLDAAELVARKTNARTSSANLSLHEREDIFSHTAEYLYTNSPSSEEIVTSCQHWGLPLRRKLLKSMSNVTDRLLFDSENSSTCSLIYKVEKLLIQSYICYKIRPFYYTGWTYRRYKNTLMQHRTVMRVAVNYTLLTERFSVVVAYEDFFPKTASNFAPTLVKDERYTKYYIDYTRFVSSLLPSPYTNDGFTPFIFDRCLSECVNDHFARYNLTRVLRESGPSSMKIISQSINSHGIINSLLNDVQSNCEDRCLLYNAYSKAESSRFGILTPKITMYQGNLSRAKNQVNFCLRNTNNPVFKLSFNLKISPFEQLINIGSIISVWFGFSVLNITRRKFNFQQKWSILHEIDGKVNMLEMTCPIGKKFYEATGSHVRSDALSRW